MRMKHRNWGRPAGIALHCTAMYVASWGLATRDANWKWLIQLPKLGRRHNPPPLLVL